MRQLAGMGQDARVAGMVWQRELLRYGRAPSRILGGLVQPLLFLFVLGYGLSPVVGESGGLDFKQWIFPGTLGLSVAMTSVFTSASIVWDREFGFLREMLASPANRGSIIVGKVAGAATVATAQGAIMLAFAPIVGIKLGLVVALKVLGLALVTAFALSSFGAWVASTVRRVDGFQVVMQFVMLPLMLLSGALFPLRDLPPWLEFLTSANPLTYAIDPMRQVILDAQGIDLQGATAAKFGPGLEIFGRVALVRQEVGGLLLFGIAFLSLAIVAFRRRG